MSERICRTCGGTYRGLVCHACHPRTKRKQEQKPQTATQPTAGSVAAVLTDWNHTYSGAPMTDAAEAAHETD